MHYAQNKRGTKQGQNYMRICSSNGLYFEVAPPPRFYNCLHSSRRVSHQAVGQAAGDTVLLKQKGLPQTVATNLEEQSLASAAFNCSRANHFL